MLNNAGHLVTLTIVSFHVTLNLAVNILTSIVL